MKFFAFLLAAALLAATSVSAQTVITAATVAAGGITAGDTAGYPATISQSGSFKLGSNLTPPSTAGGLAITGSNVYIDLNGYTIDGGITCSPNASYGVTCLGSGSSQSLINITGRNVTIRNGFVRGSRSIGVNIALAGTGAAGVTLENVVISESLSAGIYSTSDGVSLINTKSNLNHGEGMRTLSGVTLANAEFSWNSGFGAYIAGDGSSDGVTATHNAGVGFDQNGGTVRGGSFDFNGTGGYIGYGTIAHSSATSNFDYGFNTIGGDSVGLIVDSNAFENYGIGFQMATSTCYARLNAASNGAGAGGVQISGGTPIGGITTKCP
jgi:hypothetical protein